MIRGAEEDGEAPVGENTGFGGPGPRALVEQIPCAVWMTDRDLRITFASGCPRAWQGVGWDRPRAVGSTMREIMWDEPIVKLGAASVAGNSGSLRRLFHGRWYEVQLAPLRDDEGDIQGCIGLALDVTEREQTQNQLAQSEARLREVQRIAHIGNWEWDVASNRVRWSEELLRIYGLRSGEFRGTYEAFLERVLADDRDRTSAVVFDALRGVKPFSYEHRIVRSDGSVRMLHTRGDVIADAQGKVRRMVGACWDITDLWQATESAAHALSLVQATLESTADGLLVVDRKGKVVAYNQRLLELWRIPRAVADQNDFQTLIGLVHDQLLDAEACLARVREVESSPEAESFDSLELRDGRFFERYSRPQRMGEQIVGRVWSYRDVTERERSLRGALFLSDASRLLATLDEQKGLEAVTQLSLTLCEACAIDLFTSGAPRRLLALSRAAKPSVAAELPDAARCGNPIVFQDGARSCMCAPLVRHGEAIGVLSFAAPIGRHYSGGDLSLLVELARRVALSLENAGLYREARDALAARDEFLGIAAHEIRGPLAALHLAAQSLKNANPSTTAKLAAIIEREDRRLAGFVDEMLDVTKIRSGQFHFVFGPADLVQLTHEVTERLAVEISRSGSTLSITAPPSLVGIWDPARLVQVMTNLLSNAIKFGRGKPIEIHIDSAGPDARWIVTDHGIGISAEAQERIFAPFERGVSSRHYGGLGLGLFIVLKTVQGLGGSIRIESEEGAGTSFIVSLPRQRPATP
jgi:PAS domain S-box-containing protein